MSPIVNPNSRSSTPTPTGQKPKAPVAAEHEVSTAQAEAEQAVGLVKDTFIKTIKGLDPKDAATGAPAGVLDRLKSGLGDLFGKVKQGLTWAVEGVMTGLFGVSSKKFETRNVYDDPSDVNHPTAKETEAARAKNQANAAQVEAAVAKLSPEAQQQYRRVAAMTEGNPTGQLALETMLLDGRLTQGQDLKGQGTALAHLATLTQQDLAKGVDRKTLVAEVIGELENPVRINQHSVGTCGATTAQILLIRQNPSEYVRLMTGLASPAGKAQMAGGDTITRVEDWDATNDGGRTTASRLFQPAVMDYGEPLPGDRYDNSEDRAKIGPIPLWSGLMGLGKICEQLTGKDYDTKLLHHFNRNKAWDEMKQAIADGKGSVPVALRWNTRGNGAGGHFVQVDKVENGKVHITNPWGQRESFSEAEFKSHLTTITLPKG